MQKISGFLLERQPIYAEKRNNNRVSLTVQL